MKIVEQNTSYINPKDYDYDYKKFIEFIGRTCYKSEDKITDESSNEFIKNLLKRKHYAMIEHWIVYIKAKINSVTLDYVNKLRIKLAQNKFCNFYGENDTIYISANLRSILERYDYHDTNEDLIDFAINNISANYKFNHIEILTRDEFISEIVRHHKALITDLIYHTFKFTTDRGVTHELVRHREASFAQESTRYCNYSNGKFGSELTFIKPCFWEEDSDRYNLWKTQCILDEKIYLDLINNHNATPQEARTILPNSTKADIIITANETEWQHIINLRYHGTTGSPHPQMKELMDLAYPIIIEESDGRIK